MAKRKFLQLDEMSLDLLLSTKPDDVVLTLKALAAITFETDMPSVGHLSPSGRQAYNILVSSARRKKRVSDSVKSTIASKAAPPQPASSPPPAAVAQPCGSVFLQPKELAEAMHDQSIWIEQLAMSRRMTVDQIRNAIDDFCQYLIDADDGGRTLADAKKYFVNRLNSQRRDAKKPSSPYDPRDPQALDDDWQPKVTGYHIIDAADPDFDRKYRDSH